MLPAPARLRRRAEFTDTVRTGSRSATPLLVVHLTRSAAGGTRAGFVVGRGVGGAVVRNQVRRRLRHLVAQRLAALPVGTALVVRANPGAATASFHQLGADLDRALARARTARPVTAGPAR